MRYPIKIKTIWKDIITDDEIVDTWDEISKFILTKYNNDIKSDILNHAGNKWPLVVHALGLDGRMKFSTLQNRIKRISQKMLTKCVRELERDGLISRTFYPEVSPRVEYELIPLGGGLPV